MNKKVNKIGTRIAAGALIAGSPVLAACVSGPSYEDWAATDGAAGRINMDDVQKAFKESDSASEFEAKVNGIFEGDGLVLIRAKQEESGLTLEGWEDLNGNYEIDDASDDKLFDIVKRNEEHQMRGYGANSYYNSGFGGGNFLFTYMMISAISPMGYYYNTPVSYARGPLNSSRSRYRNSSGYRNQVTRNSRYFTKQNTGFNKSKYNSSGKNLGTARTAYKAKQKSTGAFKTSATGVRSSWGSSSAGRRGSHRSSSRGRSSGFRGFGGGQTIIGFNRSIDL